MKLILVQEFVHVIDSHDEGLDGCRSLQVHGSRKVDHEVVVVLSRGRRQVNFSLEVTLNPLLQENGDEPAKFCAWQVVAGSIVDRDRLVSCCEKPTSFVYEDQTVNRLLHGDSFVFKLEGAERKVFLATTNVNPVAHVRRG